MPSSIRPSLTLLRTPSRLKPIEQVRARARVHHSGRRISDKFLTAGMHLRDGKLLPLTHLPCSPPHLSLYFHLQPPRTARRSFVTLLAPVFCFCSFASRPAKVIELDSTSCVAPRFAPCGSERMTKRSGVSSSAHRTLRNVDPFSVAIRPHRYGPLSSRR